MCGQGRGGAGGPGRRRLAVGVGGVAAPGAAGGGWCGAARVSSVGPPWGRGRCPAPVCVSTCETACLSTDCMGVCVRARERG